MYRRRCPKPDIRSTATGGGTLYNRQYQGSLNYIFRFDTLGSRLSFKADYLHQNVDRNYDYDTRDFSRPEDAEPFSTELRRERYKLLGHLFASRLDLNKNFRKSARSMWG